MRIVKYQDIVRAVAELCLEMNCRLEEDVLRTIKTALREEESDAGKEVLEQILQNAAIGRNDNIPVCQDTGTTVVFMEFGQDVSLDHGVVTDAVNEGVRQGYCEGYLRKSIVGEPLFNRENTRGNTPAVIHASVVAGGEIRLTLMAKGGGAENCSRLKMMIPADGLAGVKSFVLETVREAGPNACPPLVLGVGIGGNLETCAILAKKALARPLDSCNPHPQYAELERDLLQAVNKLGIGPQGFGGRITALKVNIEYLPCHIASLPVAVNLNCHSVRHKSIVLQGE